MAADLRPTPGHRRGATQSVLTRKLPLLIVDAEQDAPGPESTSDLLHGSDIPDDRLRLLCTLAHPALDPAASTALALKLVLGLSVNQVARLLLVTDSTAAARITRAKKKVAAAGIPYTVPARRDLPARLERIRLVAYLLFTEGHTRTTGPGLVDADAAGRAIDLTRVLAEVTPDDAETAGLLALMLITHARRDARLTDEGALAWLAEQDRSRWHADEIAEGIAWLMRAARQPGPYAIQAAIAAEHASAHGRRDGLGRDRPALPAVVGPGAVAGGHAQPGSRRGRGRWPGSRPRIARRSGRRTAPPSARAGDEGGAADPDRRDRGRPAPVRPGARTDVERRRGGVLRERLRALGTPPETAD